MGEIVDMMLDGILCQYCGALVDGEASGYPRSCGCDGSYIEDFAPTKLTSGNSSLPKKKSKKRRKKK